MNPHTDGSTTTGVDASSAIVVLSDAPLSTAPGTRNAKGRVDTTKSQTKSAKATLAAQRNSFKQWLKSNAPKATVTGEHDLALNGVSVNLNGTSLATLQGAPGVVSAANELLYHPLGSPVPAKGYFNPADPDLSLIHATEAWGAGATGQGDGIKVAIVDTGIDLTNPCFSDAGYAKVTQLGDTRFTNNKVIARGCSATRRRAAISPRRRCRTTARTSPARSPATWHEGHRRRRRHPLPLVRGRAGRAARQLQHLPRDRPRITTPGARTSSTRWRPRTQTA